MKITKKQAMTVAKKFNINFDVVDFDEWVYGLNVELEHGRKFGVITNITNNNLLITAKIAVAHLLEYPDYYKRLKTLEDNAEKYWSNKKKKSIFVDNKLK